jgi:hypothetical protein
LRIGTIALSGATVLLAVAPNVPTALGSMLVVGITWTLCANTLAVAAQLSLPQWVRARGMSIHLCFLMGSNAVGAACWGQLASVGGVSSSLFVSAALGGIAVATFWSHELPEGNPEELEPGGLRVDPAVAVPSDGSKGPVLVTISYRVTSAREAEFVEIMAQTRRSRLQSGARSWSLYRDLATGRFVEHITDATWDDHVRRIGRFTAADLALRERRLALHFDPGEPPITRSICERVPG